MRLIIVRIKIWSWLISVRGIDVGRGHLDGFVKSVIDEETNPAFDFIVRRCGCVASLPEQIRLTTSRLRWPRYEGGESEQCFRVTARMVCRPVIQW